MIGQSITLLSLIGLLQSDPENTIREVVRAIRQSKAKLVVIDGFRGITDLIGTPQQMRHFLQTLGTQMAYLGVNLLITYKSNPDDYSLYPELTVADAIIVLHHNLHGLRHQRHLEVRKIRGQQSLSGLHSYRITPDGIVVYPRLETLVSTEQAHGLLAQQRLSVGVPGIDQLIGGGLNRGTTTLIAGSFGTGKTLLGLHFLQAGLAAGETVLFVTLEETVEQLTAFSAQFGLDLVTPLASGQLLVIRRPAVELDVSELATTLMAELVTHRVERVVIEGLSLLQKALGQQGRSEDYLAALVEILRSRQITTMVTLTIPRLLGREIDFSNTPFAMLGGSDPAAAD